MLCKLDVAGGRECGGRGSARAGPKLWAPLYSKADEAPVGAWKVPAHETTRRLKVHAEGTRAALGKKEKKAKKKATKKAEADVEETASEEEAPVEETASDDANTEDNQSE